MGLCGIMCSLTKDSPPQKNDVHYEVLQSFPSKGVDDLVGNFSLPLLTVFFA